MGFVIEKIEAFVKALDESIGRYKLSFTLSPQKMKNNEYNISALHWNSVKYSKENIDKVPSNKKGIYSFVICQHSKVLPQHGYVLYIGCTGLEPNRSLRDRYKEYFWPSHIVKRPHIARMIGTWHEVLWFFFAPVDDDFSSDGLKKLERQLNTALLPPFSQNDLEAEARTRHSIYP